MAAKKARGGKKPEQKYVSVEQFSQLENSVGELVELMKSKIMQDTPTAAAVIEKKETEKAGPNKYTVNHEWEDMAKEIIGEAVDHTEIEYMKGGGMKFTIVIKEAFSNAPADYLAAHKVDRRSKEVGSEGEAGVKTWCEQVRNNLKRERPLVFD